MEILYKFAYICHVCLLFFVIMAVLCETFHVSHSVISSFFLHFTHTCLLICTSGSFKAEFVMLFILAYSLGTSLKFVLIGPDKNIHYFRSIDSISFQGIR